MITLTQYLMGRDEKYKSDYTDTIKDNALILLNKVNQLLTDLKIENVTVSSGWRPKTLNDSVPGSSKTSAHIVGMAVDIADPNHDLYKIIEANPDVLRKYGLWLESGETAKTWCHLDYKQRIDRPSRIFKP